MEREKKAQAEKNKIQRIADEESTQLNKASFIHELSTRGRVKVGNDTLELVPCHKDSAFAKPVYEGFLVYREGVPTIFNSEADYEKWDNRADENAEAVAHARKEKYEENEILRRLPHPFTELQGMILYKEPVDVDRILNLFENERARLLIEGHGVLPNIPTTVLLYSDAGGWMPALKITFGGVK